MGNLLQDARYAARVLAKSPVFTAVAVLSMNGYAMTVIGVSQEGFDGAKLGYSPQIRVPMTCSVV